MNAAAVPGTQCLGSHWEERTMYDELMSPTAQKLAEISMEFKLGNISKKEKNRLKDEVLSKKDTKFRRK